MEDQIDIEGTDYTLSGLDEKFMFPDRFDEGDYVYDRLRKFEDSSLDSVLIDHDTNTLHYTMRNGSEHVLYFQNSSGTRGLFEDSSGLKWLYDEEKDITAYFNGEKYVAAHNPDIVDAWDEIIDAVWMQGIMDEPSVEDGMQRLHPEVRKRVRRGL